MITRNNLDIGQIVSNAKRDFLTTLLVGENFPASNVLHQYRTFNYRVTLAIVSDNERETQSYKINGFDYILFQSHGKNIDGVTPSGSETLNKIQSFVNMVANSNKRSYDYYLEDLYINSLMGPGQDWATKIKLKIVEPYSMDTFITALNTGIAVKGYAALDKSVCFVLKVDFVGYREGSDDPEVVPYSTRYYPMIIANILASLTSEGTKYELTGLPLNETGKLDDVNLISESIKLTGKTVGEMAKSLETALNELGSSRKKDSNIISNKYKIRFVNEKNEDVSPDLNSTVVTARIQATRMFDDTKDYGVKEFLKDKSQYILGKSIDKKTGADNIEESVISLTVDGRMGILNIIDSLIVDSYYVVDKIKKKFENEYNKEDGQLDWWRVVPTVENGVWIPSMGRYQKIITYNIIPRKVHYTKLTSIFVPSQVAPASDYESMTARVYEWNYTGNNKDITSFNINFNQLWFKLITPNYGEKPETPGSSNATKTENGLKIKSSDPITTSNTGGGFVNGGYGSVGVKGTATAWDVELNSSDENQVRSGSETNPLFSLSRKSHRIINNPEEQIMLNLEILGDPMWLGTQFIDDGSVVGNGSKLYTVDGGIAIRTVDPIVRILCYAPQDVNREGFIAPNENESRRLSSYSAHYTIIQIESFFQNGIFKQKLRGNRNVQQDMSLLSQLDSLNTGDRFTKQRIDLSIR